MIEKIIQEYINEGSEAMIKAIMNVNGGYITSKQVSDLGIHRMYLNILVDKNEIVRVDKGVYITKDSVDDVYYTFQLRYPKTVFALFTALYFHGLTEVFPYSFDIITDRDYHVNEISLKHNVFRVKKDIYELGIIDYKTSMGHYIRIYDKEKCICDLIKYKNKLDLEQVKKSIRAYVNSNNVNILKLTEYATLMGIKEDVLQFVGMYYE